MFYPVVAIFHGYETIIDPLPRGILCFICTCIVLPVDKARSTADIQKHISPTVTFTPRIPAQDTLAADFLVYMTEKNNRTCVPMVANDSSMTNEASSRYSAARTHTDERFYKPLYKFMNTNTYTHSLFY